jgi:hypothetical protein
LTAVAGRTLQPEADTSPQTISRRRRRTKKIVSEIGRKRAPEKSWTLRTGSRGQTDV